MKPTNISINEYAYELPDDRIAKYPLAERDRSKLLIYRGGTIGESTFDSLSDQLPPDTLLVRNDTKVIRARILFTKDTGGQVEIFCLEPHSPAGYDLNLTAHNACTWHCLVGNARRWRTGSLRKQIESSKGRKIILTAERLDTPLPEGSLVRFSWDAPDVTFADVLEACGVLPIPPYLHRETEASDTDNYQTVYASHLGSVAAPTAGLHFTKRVFDSLRKRNIPIIDITLHVGAGTFRPVKAETIGGHLMHRELVVVQRERIEQLRDTDKKIIAVGTTSVRTLESLYYIGIQAAERRDDESQDFTVDQWEAYNDRKYWLSRSEAFSALLEYMYAKEMTQIAFHTGILIAPGYTYRVVEGMITNFHQPQSTLLLLIAAFVGNDWHKIYDYALAHDFRFLSYGDSSLLLP